MKEKIINLGGRFVNTYLVALREGYLLVDTGYKQSEKKFWESLKKNGVSQKEIKYVFLTHHHADHTGFLASVLAKTGATLISAKENEKRLLAGKNDTDTYVSNFTSLVSSKVSTAFVDMTQCFASVTEEAVDPMTKPLAPYGIEFAKLKGHTDCDVVMVVQDCLFCGDLFMNCIGTTHLAPFWVKNKFDLVESWKTLLSVRGVNTVYVGHGKPFPFEKISSAIDYWKDKGVLKL